MSKKVITTIVLAITVGFILLVTTMPTKAEDVLPEKKPFTLGLKNKVTSLSDWVQSRPDAFQGWVADTKEFQKTQWEEGKKQTANNVAKIKYFFLGTDK